MKNPINILDNYGNFYYNNNVGCDCTQKIATLPYKRVVDLQFNNG